MEKPNFKNRSRLVRVILSVLVVSSGISSCRPDFDLDKRMPEWLGTSIYETLKEGFRNDSTGEFYTFNTFVKLIEDLDQVNVLAKTGSKTMFVADDSAFARFFENCPFYRIDKNGKKVKVSRYEELSLSQKNMILNGSMLNNVYQVASLSSTPGGTQAPPKLGNSMRKVSASQVTDSIPIVYPEQMPKNNAYWDGLRAQKDGIVLMQDGTNRPLVFFVNKFLQMNKIDNDDYDFLFRLGKYSREGDYKEPHKQSDATVNGVAIAWPNKKCFNGFLHVMKDVVYLLPNMAECIANNPDTRIYSSILERFSVPWHTNVQTNRETYDQLVERLTRNGEYPALGAAFHAHGDSVYVKKYLSKYARITSQVAGERTEYQNTNHDNILVQDPDKGDLLRFDPGWNRFVSSTVGNDADVSLQYDMGLMFVPLDDSLMTWWLKPGAIGEKLRTAFGNKKDMDPAVMTVDDVIDDMAGIPMNVIMELVNNNMQYSLVNSVPSKFSAVLNDAQDPFFENKSREQAEDLIADVTMCCNGAVFFTKSVFVPTAYKSVYYPVLVNDRLKIIEWAIKDDVLAYSAYLKSMVAEYSFFVPLIDTIPGSNFENKIVWIDPASFNLKKYKSGSSDGSLKAVVFSYDYPPSSDTKTVIADIYNYDETTGELTDYDMQLIPGKTSDGKDNNDTKFIRNRLLDLMDYHIIIGDVEDASSADPKNYSYFKTKGRGTIRLNKNGYGIDQYGKWTVEGGWQIENEGKDDAIQRPVTIVDRVDLSKKTNTLTPGNGRTYIINRPLLPSRMSVYDILSDADTYPQFQSFFKLMNEVGLFASTSNLNQIASSYCVSVFNTYHYTVYVPQNRGIDSLFNAGVLMYPGQLDKIDSTMIQIKKALTKLYEKESNKDTLIAKVLYDSLYNISNRFFGVCDTADTWKRAYAEAKSKSSDVAVSRYLTDRKRTQITNFVKYHIQDNSVYIGADFNAGIDDFGNTATVAEYETAALNSTQQYVKLKVKGGDDIEITDKAYPVPHTRKVLKVNDETSGKPYYNIMCREYEVTPISGNELGSYREYSIETSSYAVVHLIDQPLCDGDLNF